LTTVGTLSISVELRSVGKLKKLMVQGELPISGILQIQDSNTGKIVKSKTSEMPMLELDFEQNEPSYTLAVEFPELDQQPLLLVIQVKI
jgi:hypothetical protein